MRVKKDEFFRYVGGGNGFDGSDRSYKPVLYEILFEDAVYNRRSYITDVADKFKRFYVGRIDAGKIADRDVDLFIYDIKNSTEEQVINAVTNELRTDVRKYAYLEIRRDEEQKKYFAFDPLLNETVSMKDWLNLLIYMRKKLDAYFLQLDNSVERNRNLAAFYRRLSRKNPPR